MLTTTTPTNTDPRDAELTQLRAEVAACRAVVKQHPELLDLVHKLEEELFDERLAHGKLVEKYEQLEEAAIGATDTRDQLHRMQAYCRRHGLDYQGISAGRIL